METNKKQKNLYYLNELSGYVVDNDDKDVRNWKVKDKNDQLVGKVDNLIVNKSTERVVYLDVELDSSIIDKNYKPYSRSRSTEGVHDFINEDGENHLIIPIGLATLDLDDEVVYSNDVDAKTFAETKRMKKGTDVSREYEIIVIDSYDRSKTERTYEEDDAFYKGKHFRRNS